MLTTESFCKVLEECDHNDDWHEIVNELHCGSVPRYDLVKELKDKGYKLKFEESYGGEGCGDEYWVVFSVTHNNEKTCFRLNGWYASYNGGHYDDVHDFERVESRPVTVYQWFVA